VQEPTHAAGHTLGLVITRNDTEIADLYVGGMVSDHALVLFSLKVKKSMTSTQWVTSRAWRRLSHEDFASDLADSHLCCNLSEHADATVDDLIDLYRCMMTELLNKHCPVVKVRRRVKVRRQLSGSAQERQSGRNEGSGGPILQLTGVVGPQS